MNRFVEIAHDVLGAGDAPFKLRSSRQSPIVHVELRADNTDERLQQLVELCIANGVLLTRAKYVEAELFRPPPSIRALRAGEPQRERGARRARRRRQLCAQVEMKNSGSFRSGCWWGAVVREQSNNSADGDDQCDEAHNTERRAVPRRLERDHKRHLAHSIARRTGRRHVVGEVGADVNRGAIAVLVAKNQLFGIEQATPGARVLVGQANGERARRRGDVRHAHFVRDARVQVLQFNTMRQCIGVRD
jgi:hypothetical protein